MTFDLSSIYQKPNYWLPTHIEYEGQGRAEFQDPKGSAWGHTKVFFDEFNEYIVEMQVEDIASDQPLPLGLHQLLSGDKPIVEKGKITLGLMPSKNNLCTQLLVETPDGNFIAENIEFLSPTFGWNADTGTKETIRFYPHKSRFDAKNLNPAKYWVLPLINFVSKFMEYDPNLANHPLRIYPDAIIPSDIPEDKRQTAEYVAIQKSRLILFEFNDARGFIEALPDYDEKEKQLLGRQIPSAITSAMVGEIGDNPIDLDKIEQWFPFYLLDLLALAIGNEIAIPWIEFRDKNGDLVRRAHGSLSFGRSLFIKGAKAIDEAIHRGIGRLLTISQSCTELRESYFQVALRHTILGGRNGQSIEDKLDHLCRGLDALCEQHKLAQQHLLKYTSLTDKEVIQKAIKQTESIILSIAKAADSAGDTAQSRYLQTVMGRLGNVTNQDRKFGLAICDLLKKFNLPDADILDNYFSKNPRKDGFNKWTDLVSHYRGRVIHIGYFNFKTNEHEFDNIWTVTQHLHDILLRIILTILGYDGEYQPTVSRFTEKQPLDWVKPDTPADRLRY